MNDDYTYGQFLSLASDELMGLEECGEVTQELLDKTLDNMLRYAIGNKRSMNLVKKMRVTWKEHFQL